MKLPTVAILVAFSIALISAVGASAWQTENRTTVAECRAMLENSELMTNPDRCDTATEQEVTWSSWFSGKSRSTQFHFLDLFELLFGSAESKKRDYNRPIGG